MYSTFIIIGIVFLIGIALVFYKYHHRKSLHDNVDQLKQVITMIFDEAEKPVISHNRLIKGLKHHLGINEKMALKLIGKARHEDLLEVETTELKKLGKLQYKKNF
ncbi:MAG: DUF3149 domain-containing protein [Prevotella sp.]|nr:DUF3149 domain-containing protein [Prevotella sp.]